MGVNPIPGSWNEDGLSSIPAGKQSPLENRLRQAAWMLALALLISLLVHGYSWELGAENQPLQVVGTINAFTARMAKNTGHKAIYLSGGGLAANSLGMPDLGISMLEDVLTDARRITDVCDLPLLADIEVIRPKRRVIKVNTVI